MAIRVRPVRLASETDEVLKILSANLPALPHARRYEWLYRGNPDGCASTWLAYDDGSDEAIGVASVFPRAMWVGGESKIGGQVGDFAIAPAYRSLGPAVLLQKATFEPVDQEKMALCYDCPPNAAAMATFRRLRCEPNCSIERYALPLRVDRHVNSRVVVGRRPLAAAGNAGLRLYRALAGQPGGLEVAEHQGRFGDEFTELDRAIVTTDAVRLQRSAVRLNWRYRDDPLGKHRVLTARRGGELAAYLVFSEADEAIRIEDLSGRELAKAGVALLQTLARRYEKSHQVIEAYVARNSPLSGVFHRARFRRRAEAASVVAYAKKDSSTGKFLGQQPAWGFTGADVQA